MPTLVTISICDVTVTGDFRNRFCSLSVSANAMALASRLWQGKPAWCPRAPGHPQGPCTSPADLFWK